MELQGITLSEALSLALVEDAIRPLLPGSMLQTLEPRFEHARRKLKGLEEDNPAARWLDKVASVRPDLNLQTPEIGFEVLETLQKALLEEQQIRCQYYSAHSDKLRELTLNPLAMVQRGLVTYRRRRLLLRPRLPQQIRRLRPPGKKPHDVGGCDCLSG